MAVSGKGFHWFPSWLAYSIGIGRPYCRPPRHGVVCWVLASSPCLSSRSSCCHDCTTLPYLYWCQQIDSYPTCHAVWMIRLPLNWWRCCLWKECPAQLTVHNLEGGGFVVAFRNAEVQCKVRIPSTGLLRQEHPLLSSCQLDSRLLYLGTSFGPTGLWVKIQVASLLLLLNEETLTKLTVQHFGH